MTEQEWLECTALEDMLYHLEPTASRRKFLLFACACERRLWDKPDCERDKVVAAERYADGDGPAEDLLAALEVLGIAITLEGITGMNPHDWAWDESERSAEYAVNLARGSVGENPLGVEEDRVWKAAFDAERAEQCALLRDVFGNPFRPTALDARCQTAAVVALARTVYDERRFQDIPILADALEGAGCTDEVILAHCRQPAEHARGCWLLDLILGKA